MKTRLIFIVLVSIISTDIATAALHDFETVRLKSMGGAGVGSFLINESTILNPAPLAFFDISTIYLQADQKTLEIEEDASLGIPESSIKKRSWATLVTDTSSSVKGSIGYIDQKEGNNSRKKYSMSLATHIGKKSSLGLSFSKDVRHIYDGTLNDTIKNKAYTVNVGAFHSIVPWFSLGVLIQDPFKAIRDNTKAIIGTQFVIQQIFSISLDGGVNYDADKVSDTLLYRTGLQITFFKDLFLRSGYFYDKGIGEKGESFGIGWIAPKLSVEFAIKNIRPIKNYSKILKDNEKLKDASLAVSIYF